MAPIKNARGSIGRVPRPWRFQGRGKVHRLERDQNPHSCMGVGHHEAAGILPQKTFRVGAHGRRSGCYGRKLAAGRASGRSRRAVGRRGRGSGCACKLMRARGNQAGEAPKGGRCAVDWMFRGARWTSPEQHWYEFRQPLSSKQWRPYGGICRTGQVCRRITSSNIKVDRTAVPQVPGSDMRVSVQDMAPIGSAPPGCGGVSGLPNVVCA